MGCCPVLRETISRTPFSFTLPLPFLYYLSYPRTGFVQFLWCGFHLSHEERQRDPFRNPALPPCATIDCALFREEAPLCVHQVRVGSGER